MSFCYLAVDSNHNLFRRNTLSSPWEAVQGDGGQVKSVTGMPDGTLVGVGMNNLLYTRATFTSPWTPISNSGDVIAVAALPDGTLVGIGPTHLLFTRATLTSPWASMSGNVFGATALPDGTFVGIGITNPGAAAAIYDLYTRPTAAAAWVPRPMQAIGGPTPAMPMIWIAAQPDGRFVGVGADQQLYLRDSVNAPWIFLVNTGSVTAVTAAPLGRFDGLCVIRRAVMNNGTVLLDLKSVSGTFEFEWNWFVAPPAQSREVLAIALAAINANKQVNISVKAVDPYTEVGWFGIAT